MNVLLSFAQFEREVTGERIRDKVAASKKKGIWMGGTVSLGYRVENRRLWIVPEEAAIVKMIFERYLALGSSIKLLAELRAKGITTKPRVLSDGRTTGGIPFTQGPLTYFLRNRIYIGEIVHKDQSYPGEHEPILDRELFEAVQIMRTQKVAHHHAKLASSNALLMGKLFDNAGNVMSPTHSCKQGVRYRYYTSRAFIEGRKEEAGTVPRIRADEAENKVANAIAKMETTTPVTTSEELRAAIKQLVSRVVVHRDRLVVELAKAADDANAPTVSIAWTPPPRKPKREVVLPNGSQPNTRPMHAERRSKLLHAIALGRLWLQELVSGDTQDVDVIAAREGRSARSVQMLISLAFVSPDIVEASVAGRLPRGIGTTRLADLPPSWAKQKGALGLPSKF